MTLFGAVEVEGELESTDGLLAGAGCGLGTAGEGFGGGGAVLLEVEAGEGVGVAAFEMGFKPPRTLLVAVDFGATLPTLAAGCWEDLREQQNKKDINNKKT